MKSHWVTKLVAYFMIISFAGPFFDNWTSAEKILFINEAYAQRCPEAARAGPATATFRCEAQQLAVSSLLSYARMIEFFSSVATGICVDRLGPKLVAIVGVSLAIVSWLFMTFFPNTGLMLKFSMVLIGVSTNMTLFPALTIERYTTRFKATAMILICSTSSITCLLIKLVEIIARRTSYSPRLIIVFYVLIFLAPSLLASAIFFPNDLAADVRRARESLDKAESDDDNASVASAQSRAYTRQLSMNPSAMRELPSTRVRRAISSIHINALSRRYTGLPSEPDREDEEPEDDGEAARKKKWTWRGFMNALKSWEMAICTLYYCLNVVSITFAQQSYTIFYSDNAAVLEFAEFSLPFSFLPCLFFILVTGLHSQYFLILTIGLINIAMNLSFVSKSYAMGVITAILLLFSYSIYNSQIYIYIEQFVDKDYYSSTLGFLNTAGGVSLILNILGISPRSDHKTLFNIHMVLMALRAAFLVVFTVLYARRLRARRKAEAERQPERAIAPA